MQDFIDDIKDSIWTNGRLVELQQVAQENGFKFKRKQKFSVQDYKLKAFHIFKGTQAKKLKGVLSKNLDDSQIKTRTYDYVYFGHGKNKQTTILEFYHSLLNLSKFEISPKGTFNRMKELFVASDKMLERSVNFHNNYQISTKFKDSIKFELNEEFLDLIASKKGLSIEGEGKYVLFYFKNKQIASHFLIEEYESMLRMLDRLVYGKSSEEFV